MCLKPITVRNPKYNRDSYVSEEGKLVELDRSLSSQKEFIKVPCGKCADCRQTYINSILQRAIVESFTSHILFITLTYDNNHIPCLEMDGEKFLYADYNHIQDAFKRFRAANLIDREFRYMCVNEYGEDKHRPHFHLLMFIAKKEGDTKDTGHQLRQIVFDNLGDFFAINKGTRKNPIYEKLFTYKRKIKNGKEYTNFFVKYIEGDEFITNVTNEFVQDEDYIRSIRYLVGYVNKPDKYEQKVNLFIDRYKDDNFIFNRLKTLLKSQIRYSKGFGCGFTNGKKFYMDKISVRCSENTFVFTELIQNLPDTIEEFADNYEDLYLQLIEWRKKDFYKKYNSMKSALNNMSADDYLVHCIYMKYFKREFSEKYKRYKNDLQSTIGYHFKFTKSEYLYQAQKCQTYEIEKSPLYNYLRKGVEEGIEAGVPYLSFKMVGQQKYIALCKYYRDRVCTIDDTIRLFNKLGVKNYDEWMELFQHNLNSNKAALQKGNEFKYFNDDRVEVGEVKNLKTIYDVITE